MAQKWKRIAAPEGLPCMLKYAALLGFLTATPPLLAQSSRVLAQRPLELVDHVPIPSRAAITLGESLLQYHGPERFSERSTGPTIIIDDVIAFPVAGAAGGMLAGLDPDDIKEIVVLKGEHAIAAGACPGTGLIIVTTTSGHWRPKGYSARTPRADCSLLDPR